MDPRERLELMLQDMEGTDPLYRPTDFWQRGLGAIVEDLRARGFDDFRSHPSAHHMYVPLYASRAFRSKGRRLRWLIAMAKSVGRSRRIARLLLDDHSGRARAERDYLVFRASELPGPPDLSMVSESEEGGPWEQFQFDGCRYSQSFLNYLRGMNFLKRNGDTADVRRVCEIGGGYGTLGEIFLKARDDSFYLNADIPPVAAVSSWYLGRLFGEDLILTYEKSRDMKVLDVDELQARYRGVVLCPWQLTRVVGEFEMFVNFISFQEMEPDVIGNYVRIAQTLTSKFVLLRNSRQGKVGEVNPGGGRVLQPTTTDDMIAMFLRFTVLGRDSRLFGASDPAGTFESEVICLGRRPPRRR